MNTPYPQVLTVEDPIGAFEAAMPLLTEILADKTDSCELIRDIVWSVYNGHPVSLHRLHILDQTRRDVVLALINLRMDAYSGPERLLKDFLEMSGEFQRRDETLALARNHGLDYRDYPLTNDQWATLIERINAQHRA